MARETQGSPADERKLERYGVWVKVKPRDVTAPVLDESFELSDLESPGATGGAVAAGRRGGAAAGGRAAGQARRAASDSTLTDEEEKLLDELETELEPDAGGSRASEGPVMELGAGGTSAVSVPDEEPLLAESELPDIEKARRGSSDLEMVSEEELPELEEEVTTTASRPAEGAEVEVTLSEDLKEEESFDDLATLETELASVTTKTRRATGSAHGTASGGSAEILARIEDELKSIRADLNQLRTDLSGLRKSAAQSDGKGKAAEPGIKGGFLDEDEDETIALTGDELDNILNTAEITEESAESTEALPESDLLAEAPAEEVSEDILEYETPSPEPVGEPLLEVEEAVEEAAEPSEVPEETLALDDEELLPMEGATPAAAEELPSDLVLEEVPLEESAEPASSTAELPEIDLEGIPEIEGEPAARKAEEEEESETIDLETLDLGEEPKVIEAVPEQVEEVTDLEGQDEAPLRAEEVSELESVEAAEAEDVRSGREAEAQDLPEVDLEALAAEAESLEGEAPAAPVVEDLDLGELEAVSDEAAADSPQKEIEIAFEGGAGQELTPAAPADGEDVLEAEEIEEAEEVAPSGSIGGSGAGAPEAEAGGAGIPDGLKDEIRTVLKYMDHLLEALPDEKIQEFASSDYFVMYKKLFEDLGLGE